MKDQRAHMKIVNSIHDVQDNSQIWKRDNTWQHKVCSNITVNPRL